MKPNPLDTRRWKRHLARARRRGQTTCPACEGEGEVMRPGRRYATYRSVTCERCEGRGLVYAEDDDE